MHEPQRPTRCLIPFGAVVLGVTSLMGSPTQASAATDGGRQGAQPSTSVVWTMTPDGDTVRDPTSGLVLKLGGQWSPGGGSVRFGAGGGTGLGTADDGGRLSPGTRDFAVAARLTSQAVPVGVGYSPNVVQKGLAASGGQWKLTLRPTIRGARAACRFEGRQGQTTVLDDSPTRVDDGRPHDVECWREGPRVGVSVDGRTRSRRGPVGSIEPRTPTTVANKKASAGVDDQFNGSLSCLAMVTGVGSRGAADALLGC